MSTTVVTKQNIFQRFFSSIGGIFLGLILFLASFGVLFWNEGGQSLSVVLKKATEINSEQIDNSKNGQFIYTSGKITTQESIDDDLFLKPGEYLKIDRIVEMYSWEENSDSKTETSIGGTETTTTTYTYSKKWTDNPNDSSNFREKVDNTNPQAPVNRINPEKIYSNQTFYPKSAKIGVYNFNPAKTGTGNMQDLLLTPEILLLEAENANNQNQENTENNPGTENSLETKTLENQENTTSQVNQPRLENGFVFLGKGSIANPEIGDIRVSYKVSYPNFIGTIFGRLNDDKILEYTDQKYNKTVLNLYTTDFQGALDSEDATHSTRQWLIRLGGFLMMWIGLTSILAPLSVILDVLPFLGSLSRTIISAIMFLVALVLSSITILISMVFHNIFALIITLLIVFAILGFWIYSKKRKAN
jgi:hypothetical protein